VQILWKPQAGPSAFLIALGPGADAHSGEVCGVFLGTSPSAEGHQTTNLQSCDQPISAHLCDAKRSATRPGSLTHCVNPLILNSRYYPPMTDSISRLHVAIKAARTADPATSRTARLLQGGRSKVAKKLGE
jgi:hypothetical protein